jgi:dienelactone hydrolase
VVADRLEWMAPAGVAHGGELYLPASADAPRPAALIVGDPSAAPEFARELAVALRDMGWVAVVADPADVVRSGTDRAVLHYLESALAALALRREVDARALALIGLGAAGTQAFLCACTSRRVAAVVDVAGPLVHAELDASRPVQPLDMVLNLTAPVLIVHAAADTRPGPAEVLRAVAVLERAQRSVEVLEIEGRSAEFLDAASGGYHAARAASVRAAIATFLRAAIDPD